MHLSCPSQLPRLQAERMEHKCAACFDQHNTPAAIEHRGNQWHREASAKAAEREMLCTYRNIKSTSPACSSSEPSAQSCWKDGRELLTAAIKLGSSASARLKEKFEMFGEFSPVFQMANSFLAAVAAPSHWGLEPPGTVEGVPGRALSSLPTQIILEFRDP